MKTLLLFCAYCSIIISLSSCEFHCNIGNTDEPKGPAVVKEGARIYNGIKLQANGMKVEKAYLILANGEQVPESNIVSFDQPVHLKLIIDTGWHVENQMVKLGAGETIIDGNGKVLLDEKDLFAGYPDGVPANDARIITVTAKIILKQKPDAPLTFDVGFHVWDKVNGHSIDGSYKLYSK